MGGKAASVAAPASAPSVAPPTHSDGAVCNGPWVGKASSVAAPAAAPSTAPPTLSVLQCGPVLPPYEAPSRSPDRSSLAMSSIQSPSSSLPAPVLLSPNDGDEQPRQLLQLQMQQQRQEHLLLEQQRVLQEQHAQQQILLELALQQTLDARTPRSISTGARPGSVTCSPRGGEVTHEDPLRATGPSEVEYQRLRNDYDVLRNENATLRSSLREWQRAYEHLHADHLDACKRLSDLQAATSRQSQQLQKCLDVREQGKAEDDALKLRRDSAVLVEQPPSNCTAAKLEPKLTQGDLLSGLVQNLGQYGDQRGFMDLLLDRVAKERASAAAQNRALEEDLRRLDGELLERGKVQVQTGN